jgi:DGQHR domain-containing protein
MTARKRSAPAAKRASAPPKKAAGRAKGSRADSTARKTPRKIVRRALQIKQNGEHPLYVFSLRADEVGLVADISRVARDQGGKLIGYQRREVKRHVAAIADYLDGEQVIFPNAIIIALPSTVRFVASRGPNVGDGLAVAGQLEIPLAPGADPKPGWIVDGQQRALALSRAANGALPIPVTAFIADTVDVQRDQFLRINNVQPLPRGLVTELLPEISSPLSPRLSAKKIPSALCEALNRDETSPFFGLIRRTSSSAEERKRAVVTDTALISAIEESMSSTSGCLFPYRNLATNETDIDAIWLLLLTYWSAVKAAFPDAWGKPPTESRLMHSVGVRAMARLMDRVMSNRDMRRADTPKRVQTDLTAIAPECHWTSGTWAALGGLRWNELQNVPRHVRILSNHLIRVYLEHRQADR